MKSVGSIAPGLLIAILFCCTFTPAGAVPLSIESRESRAGIRVFAGAGPDVDLYDEDDDKGDLTGAFSFSHAHDSHVNRIIEPAAGEAMASGSNVTSDIVSLTTTQLNVEAFRSASGSAHEISGTANSTSGSSSFLEIFFHVIGSPANYTLDGTFIADPDTSPTLWLVSTDGFGEEFNYTSTASPNLSGTLVPGRWRFRLQMINSISPSIDANPLSFASSYDLRFNVTSTVPEPTTLGLLLPAAVGAWLIRRKVLIRKNA